MLTVSDLIYFTPIIVLIGAILISLLVIAVKRNHLFICALSMFFLALSAYSFVFVPLETVFIDSLFTIDKFARLLILMILLASFAIVIISYEYLEKKIENKEEYYLILLSGTLGSCILVIASHFISFFLGLEILSLSLFVLAGYVRTSEKGIEAALKYLMLAGVSSAFLLMGMALLYSQTGTMDFKDLSDNLVTTKISLPMVMTGFSLIVVGIGFKLAIVPFHLWIPDVFEGTPVPTTAFIASVSKAGVIALVIRLIMNLKGIYFNSLIDVLAIIAILSILFGNLLALRQKNIKRILAYSSIAHLGYILIGIITNTVQGVEAVSFYLLAYFVTIIGAFATVSLISNHDSESYELDEYKGLFWRQPWIAAMFTVILLSLAGIPLTAGFIGKFYILSVGVSNDLWLLSISLILGSVIGLYYYLRVIVEMFDQTSVVADNKYYASSTKYVLIILTLLIIWLGVNPESIAELIKISTIESFIK